MHRFSIWKVWVKKEYKDDRMALQYREAMRGLGPLTSN